MREKEGRWRAVIEKRCARGRNKGARARTEAFQMLLGGAFASAKAWQRLKLLRLF